MLNKLKSYFKEISREKWMKTAALLIIWDFLAVHGAYFTALWLRFDCRFTQIPQEYLSEYRKLITIYAVFCIVFFWLSRLYHSVWRYASAGELLHCVGISFISSLIYSVMLILFADRMPVSYHIIGMILQTGAVVLVRFSNRFFDTIFNERGSRNEGEYGRIMIIGAGAAGRMLLRDLKSTDQTQGKVVCFIDDDPEKQRRYIDGIPIVGGREEILKTVQDRQVNKIFLAIPSASTEVKRDLLNICSETDCELKQLPGLYQLALGQVRLSDMQDVSLEDLLGREPIKTDMEGVFNFIYDKTVLVTGGGGSIGSELCRQIAAHNPRQLILLDVYENSVYEISRELKEKYRDLKLVTLIGSVRDSRRMFQVFEQYHPQIVYHAAAHKHVPLMEDSPCEAIKNNVIGTYKTAYAAMTHSCERFVLISTDKAVNPTNIMGASKRLCEMIIQSLDTKIKQGKAGEIPQLFTHAGIENADKDGTGEIFRNVRTEFVAVRFGNVLGSNGSVIPIFKKQIEKGGPVTVTHPDIIRYFMTIPEAVSLVMLAGTYAHGGEIFVLDMGSPVKIDTLARNLIRLSGFKPDVDIKIEYTGLRPGEKLYEEKLMAEEGLRKTDNNLIHIGQPVAFDEDAFLGKLEDLMEAAYSNTSAIRTWVSEMVSTYHPADAEHGGVKDFKYDKLLKSEDV